MKTFRRCRRCGTYVKKETCRGLRHEYPFVCPNCDENMYRFETVKVNRNKHK